MTGNGFGEESSCTKANAASRFPSLSELFSIGAAPLARARSTEFHRVGLFHGAKRPNQLSNRASPNEPTAQSYPHSAERGDRSGMPSSEMFSPLNVKLRSGVSAPPSPHRCPPSRGTGGRCQQQPRALSCRLSRTASFGRCCIHQDTGGAAHLCAQCALRLHTRANQPRQIT